VILFTNYHIVIICELIVHLLVIAQNKKYVTGLISFSSTVIYLFTLDVSG